MKKGWIFLGLVILISLVVDGLIYFYPGLWNHNSEYEWRVLWHGRKEIWGWVFLLWVLVIGLALVLWFLVKKRLNGSGLAFFEAGLLFILGILSPVVFSQINRYGGYELLIRVLVQDHTGYWTDAQRFKSREELALAYLKSWKTLSTHSRTHPPGNILFFMGLNRIGENSEVVQGVYKFLVKQEAREELGRYFWADIGEQAGGLVGAVMMIFCGGLAVILGYFLLRRFYSAEICFISGLILVSMPSFSHKAPIMDQFFAVVILGASVLAVGGYIGAKLRIFFRGILAGVIIGIGLWFSPGVWVSVLLVPLLIYAKGGKNRLESRSEFFRSMVYLGSGSIIGILGILLLGSVFFKVNYLDIFSVNREGFYFNNFISGRVRVWKWILFNPYELLLWCSVPIGIGILVKIGLEFKRVFGGGIFNSGLDKFFIVLIIILLIINLSGQLCYESPRLLWFILPLIAGVGLSGLSLALQNFHSWWRFIFLFIIISVISFQCALFHLIY